VGPSGLLQTVADGLKLATKEDIIPAGADRLIFWIAPLFMVIPALAAWSVIPFGPKVSLGRETGLWLADLNIGILLVLALGSLNAYGPVMSGWSSNSKFAHFGALRSGAQIISYELTLGLAVLAVIVYSGSFSLVDIVESQRYMWLVIPQFLGFVIFIISAVAETNRAPFDLPEAETEIVAGYFVEYTGIRFAMFFLAEYANMFLMSMLVTVLYLGGWNGFTIPGLEAISGIVWTLVKALSLMFGYFWLRATLPRLRYDQLMAFCWKILLPLGVLNLFIAAIMRLVWS
jgi:NADH-quinone oxidoreductase subunit H